MSSSSALFSALHRHCWLSHQWSFVVSGALCPNHYMGELLRDMGLSKTTVSVLQVFQVPVVILVTPAVFTFSPC